MREFATDTTLTTTNARREALTICGKEPLPEPFESAARMVYGDQTHNEAFIARNAFRVGSLHRWRQHPEMIARVRFLACAHRRQPHASQES
jgi:hypothetical protein